VACATNQGVVVCGKAVCRKGCAYIRQLANDNIYYTNSISLIMHMHVCGVAKCSEAGREARDSKSAQSVAAAESA